MPTGAFEHTMRDGREFDTYSTAMTTLGTSAQDLAERGADPRAMSYITTGIELLARQLRDYADWEDSNLEAEAELAKLCKLLKIPHVN